GIWHPLFPTRVRLAATVLAALPNAASHRSAAQTGQDRAVVEGLVADAQSVLDRRGDSLVSWGPESRAWEARLFAELLRRRWAAGIDPPGPDALAAACGGSAHIAPPGQDGLIAAWREAVDQFEAYGAPYELAVVRSHLAEVLAA